MLKRRVGTRCPGAAAVILLVLSIAHTSLLAISGWRQSPTLNEPGHLVAGLHHWRTGSFVLYRQNPPLVRLVASSPTVLLGYREDLSGFYEHPGARPVFDMGENFIAANGRRSILYSRLGRLACIPFSLLGLWACYAWARDLYGKASGVFASALWCFSPMVLGNASTFAPDVPAAALGLVACYTFWLWLRKPTWWQAGVTGLVLGLAELSKTTMILFYPLWPAMWFVYRWRDRREMTVKRWRDEAGMLVLRMVVGIYVLNAGYLGEGSFRQLKDFQFASKMFSGVADGGKNGDNRFRDSWLGNLPVPFPANYVIGIDSQQSDFEDFRRPSYLGGRYQAKGWWYYYCYAILVKAPLGTLGLLLMTVATSFFRCGRRTAGWDEFILLAPAVVIFFVASFKSGFSHHSRYILPCVPFVFVWISSVAVHIRTGLVTTSAIRMCPRIWAGLGTQPIQLSLAGLLAVSLLAWSIVSSLASYPHSLSYFNELAGGPRNGAEFLLNSNVDWGQDLLFLEKWIETHQAEQAEPVYLAFDNYYNPFDLSIKRIEPWPFRIEEADDPVPPSIIPDGDYAISVNQLYEYPWPVRDRNGDLYYIDHSPLAHLRHATPIGLAGYSIRIFSARQLREAYAAPESPRLWQGSGR